MVSSSTTDLDAETVEVEKLFHTLEGLILQQSIGRVGTFEKLLSEHQIKLLKKTMWLETRYYKATVPTKKRRSELRTSISY